MAHIQHSGRRLVCLSTGSSSALAELSSVLKPRTEPDPSPEAATHNPAPSAPLRFKDRKVIRKLNPSWKKSSNALSVFPLVWCFLCGLEAVLRWVLSGFCLFHCGFLLLCSILCLSLFYFLFSLPLSSCLLLVCLFCVTLSSLFNSEAHQVHYQARHDCTRQWYVNSSCCCKLQTSVPGPARDGVSQMYAVIVCFPLLFLFLNCRLRSHFLL